MPDALVPRPITADHPTIIAGDFNRRIFDSTVREAGAQQLLDFVSGGGARVLNSPDVPTRVAEQGQFAPGQSIIDYVIASGEESNNLALIRHAVFSSSLSDHSTLLTEFTVIGSGISSAYADRVCELPPGRPESRASLWREWLKDEARRDDVVPLFNDQLL